MIDTQPEDDRLRSLFARAAAGDGDAREQILIDELDRLRAFIRLRSGAHIRAKESSSDLLQSVCREALGDLVRTPFQSASAFRHGLYRAAERKIIDRARRLASERNGGNVQFVEHTDEATLRTTYASILTPSVEASAREEIQRIEEAFSTLSDDQKEVITLAKLVGLPHRAIAETMQRSESAVRVLLFRALATLAERIKS